MYKYSVLIVERYTTPEGASVINHYNYVYHGGWVCRRNSCGEIVRRVTKVAVMSDVAFAAHVVEWHRGNVAPARARLEWYLC
jgi:hypothetical protein